MEQLLEIQPNLADLTEALHDLHARHQADTNRTLHQGQERTRLEADYRASYPHATDEDVEQWVWGEEHPNPAYDPPPILRKTGFTFDQPPTEDDALSALVS